MNEGGLWWWGISVRGPIKETSREGSFTGESER